MARQELSFTRADYDRLPEDLRVELIDGKLPKMASPTLGHHGVARDLFLALLRAWEEIPASARGRARRRQARKADEPYQRSDTARRPDEVSRRRSRPKPAGICSHALRVVDAARVYFGPVDFHVDDRNTFVPDVVVLPEGFSPLPGQRGVSSALLVGEILSPSTSGRDRTVKAKRYLRAGVREVWLLDPVERTIEVRTKESRKRYAGAAVARSEAVSGFETTPDALLKRPDEA